jgi:hypothetical protein
VLAFLLVAASACAGGASPQPASPAPRATVSEAGPPLTPTPALTPAPTATTAPSPSPELTSSPSPSPGPSPSESLTEEFPHDRFSDPTRIDNAWFPLKPGTQWVWEGEVNADEGRVHHRVVFTVTDLTKVIDGVRTVVGYDQDFNADDELQEAEIAFWAQDDDGNVWHLGQFPEEYEEGVVVGTPIWIAGLEGAKAGISMKAEPQHGSSYSQGWGPKVGWTDRARVFEMGSKTCVPSGCYDDVLVIDEFNRDEPDAHQFKYYARGVGNVRVGWAGALEEEQEVLELVKVVTLSPAAMARIRKAVLAQEERGYETSRDVYGRTARIDAAPSP